MARGRSRGSSKSKGSNKGVAIDLSTEYPGDVKFAVAALTDDQVFHFFGKKCNFLTLIISVLHIHGSVQFGHVQEYPR